MCELMKWLRMAFGYVGSFRERERERGRMGSFDAVLIVQSARNFYTHNQLPPL